MIARAADPYRDTDLIDSRAPRFNQAVVGVVSVLAVLTGWWWLLALLAAQLAIGLTFGRRFCLPCLAYFELVQPRSLLGHPVGGPTDYCAAEERLVERGIGELAEMWTLDAGTAQALHRVGIVELSRDGIVVADALLSKALSPTARHRVPWPDLEGRLRPEV